MAHVKNIYGIYIRGLFQEHIWLISGTYMALYREHIWLISGTYMDSIRTYIVCIYAPYIMNGPIWRIYVICQDIYELYMEHIYNAFHGSFTDS